MNRDYRICVSHEVEDPDWDRFVSETPSAPYAQSSLWSQIKATIGWKTVRMVVTLDDAIVGGVQLFIKSLPVVGSVAYIPCGPLPASPEPELAKAMLTHMLKVAADHRVQYLLLQPPAESAVLDAQLRAHGFRPHLSGESSGPSVIAPELGLATTIIDLDADLDTLQSRMHPTTRRKLRVGQRKGLTVREGSQDEVSTFYRLLLGIGERRGFSANSEQYYATVWRVLGGKGCCKLFLTHLGDEPVSALFAVSFGDTVHGWRVGWSGLHGGLCPNELVWWEAVAWAKCHGYRYFDFSGINLEAARTILRGESRGSCQRDGPTYFKLGFGGRVVLRPNAYEHIPNPALHRLYRSALSRVGTQRMVVRAIDLVRGIGGR